MCKPAFTVSLETKLLGSFNQDTMDCLKTECLRANKFLQLFHMESQPDTMNSSHPFQNLSLYNEYYLLHLISLFSAVNGWKETTFVLRGFLLCLALFPQLSSPWNPTSRCAFRTLTWSVIHYYPFILVAASSSFPFLCGSNSR